MSFSIINKNNITPSINLNYKGNLVIDKKSLQQYNYYYGNTKSINYTSGKISNISINGTISCDSDGAVCQLPNDYKTRSVSSNDSTCCDINGTMCNTQNILLTIKSSSLYINTLGERNESHRNLSQEICGEIDKLNTFKLYSNDGNFIYPQLINNYNIGNNIIINPRLNSDDWPLQIHDINTYLENIQILDSNVNYVPNSNLISIFDNNNDKSFNFNIFDINQKELQSELYFYLETFSQLKQKLDINIIKYMILSSYLYCIILTFYNDLFFISKDVQKVSGLTFLNSSSDLINSITEKSYIGQPNNYNNTSIYYLLIELFGEKFINNLVSDIFLIIQKPVPFYDSKINKYSLNITLPIHLVDDLLKINDITDFNDKLLNISNNQIHNMFYDNTVKPVYNDDSELYFSSKSDYEILVYYINLNNFTKSYYIINDLNNLSVFLKRDDIFILCINYSISVKKWSKLLLIYFSDVFNNQFFDSNILCSLNNSENDSTQNTNCPKIPYMINCYSTLINKDLIEFRKICNCDISIPNRFRYPVSKSTINSIAIIPSNFFLTKLADDCKCINNNIYEEQLLNKDNLNTGLCFTNQCTDEQRKLYKINDITCKKYCSNINSLINDKSLGPKRKDHISNNRLSKICGIEWSAFSNDINHQVLFLSLITSLIIVLLISLKLFGDKNTFFVSNSSKITVIFISGLLLILFSYYLSKELAGQFGCVQDKISLQYSGKECTSQYLGLKLPLEFCSKQELCECEDYLANSCGKNCFCKNTVCYNKDTSKPRLIKYKNVNRFSIIYLVFCIILTIILPFILIQIFKIWSPKILKTRITWYLLLLFGMLLPQIIYWTIYFIPYKQKISEKNCD